MAQSVLISPIGVPLFWEAGANPNQEWAQWLSTFKLAVMAKENLKVEKLLRTRPTPADLFYHFTRQCQVWRTQDQTNQKKNREKETLGTKEEKLTGKMSVKP